MWNAYLKWDRLKKALQMREIDPSAINLDRLGKVLVSRGISDATLNPIVWKLIKILEPPGCSMTHCKHYGNSRSPMNCVAGKVPGRCTMLKDYLKRKEEREQDQKS